MIVDELGHTISLDVSKVDQLFFNCCSPEDQLNAIRQLCSEPFLPMTEKLNVEKKRFEKIPKIYVECTKDNALTVEAQQIMSSQYNCSTIRLPTDHSPFLSCPEEVLKILSLKTS